MGDDTARVWEIRGCRPLRDIALVQAALRPPAESAEVSVLPDRHANAVFLGA